MKNNKNKKHHLLNRNELHFHIQKNTRATVTKNKKKIIPRKQKYKRIDY